MKKTKILSSCLVIMIMLTLSIFNCSIRQITVEPTFKKLGVFQLRQQADQAYREQNYKMAVHYYVQALEQDQNDAIIAYNLACSYALQEDAENAAIYVAQAFAKGYQDLEYFYNDTDFNCVRENSRFKETVAEIVEKIKAIGTEA